MQNNFTIVLFAEHFTNNLFEFISDGAVDQEVNRAATENKHVRRQIN